MGSVVLAYFVGAIVAVSIFRVRAGLGLWRGLTVLGAKGVGLEWFCTAIGKALVWPAVLLVWLVSGRPEPRVVFNEKAEARHAASELP